MNTEQEQKKRYEWCLAVGKLESGMAPKKGAMKELREEIGVKAKKLTLLSKYGHGNSYEHLNYVFLAEGLTPAPLTTGEEDEDITIHPTSVKKALQMVLEGEINIPDICFAILLLNKHLKAKK